jgi:hypothetical protein
MVFRYISPRLDLDLKRSLWISALPRITIAASRVLLMILVTNAFPVGRDVSESSPVWAAHSPLVSKSWRELAWRRGGISDCMPYVPVIFGHAGRKWRLYLSRYWEAQCQLHLCQTRLWDSLDAVDDWIYLESYVTGVSCLLYATHRWPRGTYLIYVRRVLSWLVNHCKTDFIPFCHSSRQASAMIILPDGLSIAMLDNQAILPERPTWHWLSAA